MTRHTSSVARYTALGVVIALLTGCSAMLVGDGSANNAPIGSDDRAATQVAADDALSEAVGNAISNNTALNSADVIVSARSGVVTLGGTVSGFDLRDQAVQVASGVSGVSRVDNQIKVNTRDQRQ